MKRLGVKKTKTKAAGHQRCAVCHPETKAGRANEKKRGAWELDRLHKPTDFECDCLPYCLTAEEHTKRRALIREHTQ